MNKLRRVGLETGLLTDEEIQYIDNAIIEAAHPTLRAREIFEIEPLPNAGIREIMKYNETDMGQAVITMDGETLSVDKSVLTGTTVKVPVLSKDVILNWRDILAARHNNMPLDLAQIQNASRQVAEEENLLSISGQYTGWAALGIEGLSTATNRNTEASAGAWPANAYTDINDAIAELEADGHGGPYALIGRVAEIRKLNALISNTNTTYKKSLLENGIVQAIYGDDSLFASDGDDDSALIVEPGKMNFSLKVAQDITSWQKELDNMNKLIRVFEVAVPVIKRPTSICEITSIT